VSSSLTLADVERVAALAQLELTADEKALFTRQLADILHHAIRLSLHSIRPSRVAVGLGVGLFPVVVAHFDSSAAAESRKRCAAALDRSSSFACRFS
jgi:hypothetical protein